MTRLRGLLADSRSLSVEVVECVAIEAAVTALRIAEADCVLLGATSDDPEGLLAIRTLRESGCGTPAIVLAMQADRQSVARASDAGAQDLLLKGQFDSRLLMRSIDYAVDRKRVEVELTHQALHDAVTGLPNRALFLDRLGKALLRLEHAPHNAVAVLLLDIDRFRVINDSLGHDLGDRLLLMFAERVSAALGANDSAARFGGDEFAILCEGIEGARGARDVARRIEHALSAPFMLEKEAVFLRTSAGVALATGLEASPDSLLREADSAMNRAKERGGGTLEIFEGTLHERAMRRLNVEHSLHTALERGELTLSYQPQFRLGGDDELYGTEALVRWNHPVRGVVGPDEFIGSAEETGLVIELGAWVLQQACVQALAWPIEMSVNVAARQCIQPGFVQQVDQIIETTGIDPTRLCLELTETGPIRDDGIALKVLTELKSRGISLAVDDFGTGYSSLQALRQLPFDIVKIDKSFIESIHTHQRDAAVVRAVIDLAHAIGLTVVAEGVEHQAQHDLLLQMGCDCAQGFHLARPASPRELESRFTLRH
jgi:diguanylate cyclase (GGDEF)-like protein